MNEEKKERTFVSAVIYLHDIDADVLDFIKKLYSIFSVNFENFEKRRSGSRWFWVVGSKDNPGELV